MSRPRVAIPSVRVPDDRVLLTHAGAAKLLQCSTAKVRTMVRTGQIPDGFVFHLSASDKRIKPAYFDPLVPLDWLPDNVIPFARPSVSAEDFRVIVRDELANLFAPLARLDRVS